MGNNLILERKGGLLASAAAIVLLFALMVIPASAYASDDLTVSGSQTQDGESTYK